MTTGETLLALIAAVLVPGIIVHFTLGRNGGHDLLKGIPKRDIRGLPLKVSTDQIKRNLRGSLATLIGLGVAALLYPMGCMLGLPINVFGIPDDKFVLLFALGVALVIVAVAKARR